MSNSQCDFNLGLQRPVYPINSTPPHGKVLPTCRGLIEGCSSMSEENDNLSWLPYPEGAEKSLGKEQARQLTQTLPTSTKKENPRQQLELQVLATFKSHISCASMILSINSKLQNVSQPKRPSRHWENEAGLSQRSTHSGPEFTMCIRKRGSLREEND